MKKKLTGKSLQGYLWEAMQDFKEGGMTVNELTAITNTAGKIVQIALLDVMSKNSIGNNKKEIE